MCRTKDRAPQLVFDHALVARNLVLNVLYGWLRRPCRGRTNPRLLTPIHVCLPYAHDGRTLPRKEVSASSGSTRHGNPGDQAR
jgi:hypothetical protein